MKILLRSQVFKAISEIPVGTEFTSKDILESISYKHANIASVASAIKEFPGVINTTPRKVRAIWRRTE